MAQKTSWNGSMTRMIRARGWKNAYTRYRDRNSRTGLEIVIPHKSHLEIRDSQGKFIRNEVKYHHYNSDETTANSRYQKVIKKQYDNYLKRARRK